ncbi:MAG: efflux transporter outer membrane subunit [Candidatus Krumholzibacteriota bacterium]
MMIRFLTFGALLLLLAGCSVGPDYARPELGAEVPAEWAGQTPEPVPEVTMADALPDTAESSGWRWWESFGDATLNSLVADALVYNNNLAAAAGRVAEARAMLGGAKSARWPTLEIGGTAARSKSSEQLTQGFGPIYSNQFSADATLRYEVDLWGRLSRGKEAAQATLLASEQDRRAVAQALIADVVRAWLVIRELQLQVALTERTIANFGENLITVRERYRRGLVSALDVHLAGQNLAAAQAADPAFRQELASARRRLEILAGRYPAGDLAASDLEGPGGSLTLELMPDPLDTVPAGLPSDLLERRPDLMAAEMRLHSSVARVGEAKAALYPRIMLTASGGSKSADLSDLFTSGSDFWSLAGNLFMPLINRGATKAQIKAAEARVTQATAGYRQSILVAFSEVENALDQDLYQAEQEEYLADSAEQARRAVNLAQDRYRRGLDSLLITLESQRRLFNAESQLLKTQRARRSARVNLIQALGGPWDPDPATTDISMNRADSNEGAQQ